MDKFIYQRIVIELCALQMEQHPREVRALIVFGTASMDPNPTCWRSWRSTVDVVYLDDAMRTLAEIDPDHFLISLFRPLLEPEESEIEKLPPMDYDRLKGVKINDSEPAGLEAIFVDWLAQLFKTRTRTQITKMTA